MKDPSNALGLPYASAMATATTVPGRAHGTSMSSDTIRFHDLFPPFVTSVAALRRDLKDFRAAGLIDGNILRMWRDHVEVRRYRRAMRDHAALAALTGQPAGWS